MSWTLTTSGACIIKAGLNANSTIVTSGAALAKWSDEVEGRIVQETRKNFVVEYASLNDSEKNILDDTASDLIAMKIINYDMAGFTSRVEAQTMLDVLKDNSNSNLKLLRDFKTNEIRSV